MGGKYGVPPQAGGVGENIPMKKTAKKILVSVSILLLIAMIHIFRIGTWFSGSLYDLYYAYFSDVILPFGIYFLLCINEFSYPFLRRWGVKAAIVFAVAATAEICQGLGIAALGVTFDPLDFVMYGLGVLLAALVDTQVFARLFPFWNIDFDEEL
jgi:hypothetical protein